jgi:GDP-6-deoxy-D-talose 4-dehydrogenase
MVAALLRACSPKATAGELINVCSGKAYTLKGALAKMAEIAGYETEVFVNPAFVWADEVKRGQGNAGKLRGAIGEFEVIPLWETMRWIFLERSS